MKLSDYEKHILFWILSIIFSAWLLMFGFLLLGKALADTGLTFENDVFAHTDRWLTNRTALFHDRFSLDLEMYTPRDKSNPGIPVNDRPWDGVTLLGYTMPLQGERELAIRAGALGHASGQDRLQKFIHDGLGRGIHPAGWRSQNPSEPALDLVYTHRYPQLMESWFGQVRVEPSYEFRAGNVVDSASTKVDFRRGWVRYPWNLYVVSGLRGSAVAFNTTLDGRMFHNDTYTVDRIPFIAASYCGFGVRYDHWVAEFIYTYLTDETRLQNYDRALYGGITVKWVE